MSYWFDYLVEKERRRQEMAQAEASRRAKQILQVDIGSREKLRLWPRLLAFVGQRLISWGYRLQQHSASVSTATAGLVQEPLTTPQNRIERGCQ